MSDYFVRLRAMGHPKFLQPVSSLEAAAAAWEEYREAHGVRSDECFRNCGDVIDLTGNTVAKVSYNGRVWIDGKPQDGLTSAQWIGARS
jgi:hypothetical protein